jgi:hypothetical protein
MCVVCGGADSEGLHTLGTAALVHKNVRKQRTKAPLPAAMQGFDKYGIGAFDAVPTPRLQQALDLKSGAGGPQRAAPLRHDPSAAASLQHLCRGLLVAQAAVGLCVLQAQFDFGHVG